MSDVEKINQYISNVTGEVISVSDDHYELKCITVNAPEWITCKNFLAFLHHEAYVEDLG